MDYLKKSGVTVCGPLSEPTQGPVGWAPEHEPAYVQFEEALDKFSLSTSSKSWDVTLTSPSPPQPWSETQTALLVTALKQAPKALMAAPYDTIGDLIRLRDLAAEQNKLPEAFWKPLSEACHQLHMNQK